MRYLAICLILLTGCGTFLPKGYVPPSDEYHPGPTRVLPSPSAATPKSERSLIVERPTVYVFCADWCPACDKVKGRLEELRARADVVLVDIDEEPELARRYNIRRVPTLVVVQDGKELYRAFNPILVLKFLVALVEILL